MELDGHRLARGGYAHRALTGRPGGLADRGGQRRCQRTDQAGPALPECHAQGAAGHARRDRLAHHLASDPLGGPAEGLSVPNSRTRRDTPATVSKLAIKNAAASTPMDSHRPRSLARLDAVASEPVIAPAIPAEVVTVAVGSSLEICCRRLPVSAALVAAT